LKLCIQHIETLKGNLFNINFINYLFFWIMDTCYQSFFD